MFVHEAIDQCAKRSFAVHMVHKNTLKADQLSAGWAFIMNNEM